MKEREPLVDDDVVSRERINKKKRAVRVDGN